MKAHGYSIWLLLPASQRQKLGEVIYDLSTKYGGPLFEPHITLVGSLEGSKEAILNQAAVLAATLKPLQITLGRLSSLETWFRCLFIEVELSSELQHAYYKAKDCFQDARIVEYKPHVSLLYGFYSKETKEKIIHELPLWSKVSFSIHSIAVVSTEGEPKDWFFVKTYSL